MLETLFERQGLSLSNWLLTLLALWLCKHPSVHLFKFIDRFGDALFEIIQFFHFVVPFCQVRVSFPILEARQRQSSNRGDTWKIFHKMKFWLAWAMYNFTRDVRLNSVCSYKILKNLEHILVNNTLYSIVISNIFKIFYLFIPGHFIMLRWRCWVTWGWGR